MIILYRSVSFKFVLLAYVCTRSIYMFLYVRIIHEKTKGQISLRPSLGKHNTQPKEVYSEAHKWAPGLLQYSLRLENWIIILP